MIEDRIGQLRVHVRTDVPDAEVIRPAVELIVRSALERCAAILEERAPGRLVLIRRLPMHFQCDDSVLDDASQVEDLARAAADTIERIAIASALDPPVNSDSAVMFDDEAHLRASHLLALARGRPAWFHAALDGEVAGDPLAALAAPHRRAIALSALAHLARGNVLAEVLAAQPGPVVSVLAAALDLGPPPARRAYGPGGFTATPPGGMAGNAGIGISETVRQLAATGSRWPLLPTVARALALQVHAAVLLDAGIETAEAHALAVAAADVIDAPDAAVPTIQQAEPARIAHLDETDREIVEDSASLIPTRFAGLFYLLDRVQELDLSESLWKACLPEGMVLAAAASALLGPGLTGDAAPTLFGGVDVAVACPEVTPEQQAEIAIATCAALAAALPRRDLADIPPVHVTLAEHATGRLLVAVAEGSPFAFFAWPAVTPELPRTGLRALLDSWPHRGVLSATPALASLDVSGRLRSRTDEAPVPLLLPDAPSVSATALLALVAGAPCQLFAARAGAPPLATVEAFVARYLARHGRVRISPERMDVIFDANDVDLDVRRAGLDRDPGWLAWLKRSVHFIFEERDPTVDPQSSDP